LIKGLKGIGILGFVGLAFVQFSMVHVSKPIVRFLTILIN